MSVGVYLRVSTEEQRDRQSIATQRDLTEEYCSRSGLRIHAIYADDGVSGTIPLGHRPEGGRLIRDARLQKFDQLVVYKLDRIGRDPRFTLEALAQLEECGVVILSVTESLDRTTSSGKMMSGLLSVFAGFERDLIRERSIAGTNRLAEAGVWLGGIVPYGYRKQGEKREARIVVNDEQIPGFDMSEADVVRLIYRMSGIEGKSCQRIADHLNRTGIPCGSVANSLQLEGGKRNRRIAPIWRHSHVRNMIISRTYMGQHQYGKRTKNPNRKIVVRDVPAIASPETWDAAQQALRTNRIICRRNTRQPFLLRGLVKCGLCGLTFSGMRMRAPQRDHYYRCNGRQFARGLYGIAGKKCPAKNLNGDYVERLVWADIESFLRNPGELLGRLRDRLAMQDGERLHRQKELDDLGARLEQKTEERDRVVSLFRRGRIDEKTLDEQLDQIKVEAEGLQLEIDTAGRALSAGDRTAQLQSAESLLATLRDRLTGPIPHQLKRQIVEILVESIQANTVERWGVQQSEITITYRFTQPSEPAALVLPRLHRMSSRNHPPEQLNTLGDHLVRRRLTLKLLQRQVAEQIGVKACSIVNWEKDRTKPDLEHIPAIIRFLGYNPLPQPAGLAGRLVQCRTALGIAQKQAAQQLGIDPCTLARWERGEREPEGAFLIRVRRFLEQGETSHPEIAPGCIVNGNASAWFRRKGEPIGAAYQGIVLGLLRAHGSPPTPNLKTSRTWTSTIGTAHAAASPGSTTQAPIQKPSPAPTATTTLSIEGDRLIESGTLSDGTRIEEVWQRLP